MKNLTLFACLFLLGVLFYACQPGDKSSAASDMKEADAKPAMTKSDTLKRGETLFYMMGCHDCHTPKIMTAQGPMLDTTRLLSGHPASDPLPKITDKSMIAPGNWYLGSSDLTAWVGPWGTSFTANLTPDETGTGNWTFENFKTALRQGKFKGLANGRTLLPPMPWQLIGKATDEDLAYMWAYLRTVKPIKNAVPEPLPPMK
jgi:hypothetical protein